MTAKARNLEQLADLTLQFGSFTTADLANLAGISAEEIEDFLRSRPNEYEWVDDQQSAPGFWRLKVDLQLAAASSSPTPNAANLDEAQHLIGEAQATLRYVESGSIQDLEARRLALLLAEQRLSVGDKLLQTAAPNEAAQSRESLRAVRVRMNELDRSSAAGDHQIVLDAMRDWTVPLPGPSEHGPPKPQELAVTLEGALDLGAAQAGIPGAVFGPAGAMLGAQLPPGREGRRFATDLGQLIRESALRGEVFRVLALGFVAAVLGTDYTADALLAAITTPAFRGSCDRAAIRMAYAALANLARPGTSEPRIAAEACAYLLRREHPGPDEMEMLSPAALYVDDRENPAQLLQITEWVGWEQNHDPEDFGLSRLARVARNLVCTLDTQEYLTLERVLELLKENNLSTVLVNYLSAPRNAALQLSPLPQAAWEASHSLDDWLLAAPAEYHSGQRQYGAAPRDAVARVTGNKKPIPLEIAPASLAARAIAELMRAEIYDSTESGGLFSSRGFGGVYAFT